MSNALIIMLAVMGGTMLLRAPISFGMLAGGCILVVILLGSQKKTEATA